jgi:hypothetical protein
MTLDRSFVELNRASTKRVRDLAARLSDEEMQHPVGAEIVFSILAMRPLTRPRLKV